MVATVILFMNILIAMMNNTYDDVACIRDIIWGVEGLEFAVWMAQDNVLWIRTLCRLFLNHFVFKTQQGIDGPSSMCERLTR